MLGEERVLEHAGTNARACRTMLIVSLLWLALVPLEALSQPTQTQTPVVGGSTFKVRGTVVDAETGARLSFANVALEGTMIGTATNRDGRFVLNVRSLPICLAISYIGYKKEVVQIDTSRSEPVRVTLKPSPVSMDELVVDARNASDFVDRAVRHLFDLLEDERRVTRGVRGFYRQRTIADESNYVEYIETFYNSFVSPFGIRQWDVDQGRYAVMEDRIDKLLPIHTNFSSFTGQMSLPDDHKPKAKPFLLPLRLNAADYFTFEKVRSVQHEGRQLVEISYRPKEPSKPVAGFSGRIWVDVETYAIHKFEGALKHPTFRPIVLYFDNHEARQQKMEFSFSYRSLSDPDVTVIERVNFRIGYGIFADDVLKSRMDVESTFFVYDFNPQDTFGASPMAGTDYERIDAAKYDPEFWSNNPVLARTPVDQQAIASFEQTGAFGKLVESTSQK
jgi:hypothetical protein